MSPDRLSSTFAALADPTRRAILARLASGETSVMELAEPFDMSLAYAFVDGQWLPCTADAFLQMQGCSDTKVIEVTRSQMEETGVSHFECPTCLAVRDIQPKGGRVKFPSHSKRMTTTPNRGSRWVKQEIAWKLSDA